MSYTTLLTNTCTTQRFSEGALDGYGNPAKGWANYLIGISCRWSTPKNLEVKIGAEIVIVELQLFVDDVDITVQDRVVLDSKTYEVISVLPKQDGTGIHHKEVYLRTVST